jgi:hypothetical protein
MRPTLAAALLTCLSAAPGSDAIEAAAYPGARRLLEREVEGRTIRIRFRCYATADPIAKVVAYYAGDPRFARARFRLDPGEEAFALRRDKDLHVAVFPAANAALHRQCEAKPEAGDQTMLQISQGRAR